MGERAGYTPGTFGWVDLGTNDVAASRSFYGSLFGWEVDELPGGEGGTAYSMFTLHGKNVAACFAQPPQQRDLGAPPSWNSYVIVESADDSVAKAAKLGATIVMPPTDVSETDRVGVITDPQGAVLGLLQSTGSTGAQLVNEPGALTWNELLTEDTNAAKDFYGALFGWTFDDLDMGDGLAYVTHKVGERSNGGMMAKMPGMEGLPNFWGVYFAVQEVEEVAKKAESLGGRVMQEPMEVPGGKFVPIVDPQGVSFSIFSGEFDD